MQPNAHKSELQTDQFLMLSALVEVFAFFPWQMQDIRRRDSESFMLPTTVQVTPR